MGKNELIDRIAERFDGNREAAQHALDSVVEGITRSLAAGEKVSVRGLGVFDRQKSGGSKSNRDAEPTFVPTQELKDVVAGARKARSRVLGSLSMVPAQAAVAAETAGRAASAAARAAADVIRGDEDATADAGAASPAGTRSADDNVTTASEQPEQPAAATSGGATPPAQTPVKKVPAKKGPVKKAPVKKAPVKKVPAKETAAKKPAAKKSTAKKTPTKKTTGGSTQNATSS